MKKAIEKISLTTTCFLIVLGYMACTNVESQKQNSLANNQTAKADTMIISRGYLGIDLVSEADEADKLKEWKLPNKVGDGVLILSVDPKSEANKAGIKERDIIVSINGIAVGDGADLVVELEKYKPNDKVKVAILRNGLKYSYDVVLESRNDPFMKKNDRVKE